MEKTGRRANIPQQQTGRNSETDIQKKTDRQTDTDVENNRNVDKLRYKKAEIKKKLQTSRQANFDKHADRLSDK